MHVATHGGLDMSVSLPSFSSESSALKSEPSRLRNVADMMLLSAQQHPHSGVRFISPEHDDEAVIVPYPTLLNEARRILGGLQGYNYPPGENMLLLLERPCDIIPAFWACVLGGYVPCPLSLIHNDPERWAKHLAHVTALLDHPMLITTGALRKELPSGVTAVDLEDLRIGKPQDVAYDAALRDPAVLMLTSGSTGNSKAVVLTHGNLLTSMMGRAARQQLTSSDVTLNWIAFDHVAALLQSHMIALYVAAPRLHAEPATILADPLRFLRLIHYYRVSIAFAPNFLLGQINASLQSAKSQIPKVRAAALDLSCLRRIVTGGEANVVGTGRRFFDLLASYGLARNTLWPAFGMTETCAASVYSHEFPDRDADRE